MSKKAEKLQLYKEEMKNLTNNLDFELLESIVNFLGLTIFRKDAELVSINDEKEIRLVKTNFIIKKLGITNLSEKQLDNLINEVAEIVGKSNKRKFRAIFYYFLIKKLNKEYLFVGEKNKVKEDIVEEIINNEKTKDYDEVDKITKLVESTNNLEIKNISNNNSLYITLILNLLVIVIIVYLLSL